MSVSDCRLDFLSLSGQSVQDLVSLALFWTKTWLENVWPCILIISESGLWWTDITMRRVTWHYVINSYTLYTYRMLGIIMSFVRIEILQDVLLENNQWRDSYSYYPRVTACLLFLLWHGNFARNSYFLFVKEQRSTCKVGNNEMKHYYVKYNYTIKSCKQ